MKHDLKILPEHFNAVADGRKPFEVRRNDWDYQVGDILHLREDNKAEDVSTRRTIHADTPLMNIAQGVYTDAI